MEKNIEYFTDKQIQGVGEGAGSVESVRVINLTELSEEARAIALELAEFGISAVEVTR